MKVIKKAFTLIELIVVVTVIWILIMWLTVYLWWIWERAKIIEAQWCAASLWWQMNNYVFNALTSRSLRIPDNNNIVSPDHYIITLSWWTYNSSYNCTSGNFNEHRIYCNELRFLYTAGSTLQQPYKTQTIWNTCRQNQAKIWMFWSSDIEWKWDIEFISMNKWFAPRSISERKVFYLQNVWGGD